MPAAAQKAALDALMATLKPSELALSRAVLSKIPPRPSGYGRTRELFPRNTGGAFDPITPATVAADMTVGFLLTNDRAARMVAQKAVDPTLPGLDDVIDRVVAATFDAPAGDAVRSRDQTRRSSDVVVDRLIDLAETAPMTQVRAIATQKLKAIQARAARPAVDRRRRREPAAHRDATSSASSIGRASPRAVRRLPGTPPGAPIGDAR